MSRGRKRQREEYQIHEIICEKLKQYIIQDTFSIADDRFIDFLLLKDKAISLHLIYEVYRNSKLHLSIYSDNGSIQCKFRPLNHALSEVIQFKQQIITQQQLVDIQERDFMADGTTKEFRQLLLKIADLAVRCFNVRDPFTFEKCLEIKITKGMHSNELDEFMKNLPENIPQIYLVADTTDTIIIRILYE
jgi:hypothetical protein